MTVARPLVSSINVVYLYVRDVDRSVAFYRDLLGVPLVRDEHDAAWAEAKLPGGIRFALHQSHPGGEPQTPSSVVIDFETSDIEAAAERLRAAGVRVGELMRKEWGSALEVYDPDGYRIDLFEPPAG